MKRSICLLLAVLMALSVFSGCAKEETPAAGTEDTVQEGNDAPTTEDLPVLRVAVLPVISSIAIPYIMDQGWDVENGFQIETVTFSSGAPMGEALLSNEWDIGIMSAAGVYAAANYEAMCIADTSDSIGVDGIGVFVRQDSEIAQIKGSNPTYPNVYGDADSVRGKTILCPTGTLSQMHVMMWLESIGLTADDVELVHMEFTQAYQAFLSGQGDIVALNPPFCYQLADEGYVSVAPTEELDVGLSDMVFANKTTYEEKKDIIKKCLELIYQADADMEADAELKASVLKDWYSVNGSELDDSAIQQEITKRLYTIDDIKAMETPVGSTLVSIAEFYASIGNIETDQIPTIEGNINTELMDEILKN